MMAVMVVATAFYNAQIGVEFRPGLAVTAYFYNPRLCNPTIHPPTTAFSPVKLHFPLKIYSPLSNGDIRMTTS